MYLKIVHVPDMLSNMFAANYGGVTDCCMGEETCYSLLFKQSLSIATPVDIRPSILVTPQYLVHLTLITDFSLLCLQVDSDGKRKDGRTAQQVRPVCK